MNASAIANRPEDGAAHGFGLASGRNDELFEVSLPAWLQRHAGLLKPNRHNVGRRALLVVAIGWLPLVIFTLVASISSGGDILASFLRETGVHARYLVAAPVLVLAERECASQLNALVRQFLQSGIVPGHKFREWERSVASTRVLLNSRMAEFVIVVGAYAMVAATIGSYPSSDIPLWHRSPNFHFSIAGWWHVVVSLPLLLILILGWIWRLALWARLLLLISGLDLRLVVSHPDRVGGIGFIGHSVRAFAVVAMALSVIAAGRAAHVVLESGAGLPTPQLFFNIVFLAAIAVLFTAPLLMFVPALLQAWRDGSAKYGALALRVGAIFEDKWFLHDSAEAREGALEKPDFSATADLYGVVSNVYAFRFVPIDLGSLIALGLAMLLPFVPVVLLAIPLDHIWSGIQSLLF